MSNKELISALTDDEASAIELAQLPSLLSSVEARDAWHRYHLIGELMRDAGDGLAARSLVDRVALQVATESALGQSTVVPLPARPRGPSRWQRAMPMAAAAAIGAIAVGLWQAGGSEQAQPFAAVNELEPTQLAVATLPAEAAQVSTLPADEYRRRMDSYLLNFNQQRSRMAMPQAPAFVRVVGFEGQDAAR